MSSDTPVSYRKQEGIVVLVLVIIIAVSTIAYALSEFSPSKVKHQQVISAGKALSRAKDALIAHAVARADVVKPSEQPGRLGYLPCPANDNGEGNSVGNCGSQNEAALGWLPWRSLGLPPLRDESGTCLLYAVSGSYKFRPPTSMLNEDTYGMFQVVDHNRNVVQGLNPEDRVVAIVFAPGPALQGQARFNNAGSQCGNDANNFSAYLDTYVDALGAIDNSDVTTGIADQIDQFIHATDDSISSGVLNDRFITITRDEIWSAIMQRKEFDADNVSGDSRVRRVTEALARCLAQYGNDNANLALPYPAPVGLKGSDNDYRNRDHYVDAPETAGANHFGRFPYIVDEADAVISPATNSNNRLFNKSFSEPPIHPPPNNIRECDDIPILYTSVSPVPPVIPVPSGTNANLRKLDSEDRIYWENRKDHFFYAVSNSYRPTTGSTSAPRCGSCITVGGVQYAAVVIYSGEKLPSQSREAPVAPSDTVDTKSDWANYVEFSGITGDGTSTYVSTGNDVMFCITDTDPLAVVPCQ
jgi:hypothetical protein